MREVNIESLNVRQYFKEHKKAFDNWREGGIINAWYDENNILCIKYESGKWWHYKKNNKKQLEWW